METAPFTKSAITEALMRFARQRSGMDYRNYGDAASYRAEQRTVTRDLHDARALLSAISWRDSIDGNALMRATRDAYSGRLSIVATEKGALRVDYCVGQYFPTEYRRAVCAVLASAFAGDYLRRQMRNEFGRGIASRRFN